MLVNQNVTKHAVFVVARKAPDDYEIRATAFLVFHMIEGTDKFELYAVTARHVIEKTSDKSCDGTVYLRLNALDDGAFYIPAGAQDDWEYHEDDTVDVAVIAIKKTLVRDKLWLFRDDGSPATAQLPISSDQFATDDVIRELKIGVGHELFFPGLFSRVPGSAANIPILRTGTVAAMSKEKMQTALGQAVVYLAELRSIGGHSGSPVFVHLNFIDKQWELRESPWSDTSPLLGLVHGYVHLRRDQFTAFVPSDEDEELHDKDSFNSGIAVITPAMDILHVLNQPRLVQQREATRDAIITRRGGTTLT